VGFFDSMEKGRREESERINNLRGNNSKRYTTIKDLYDKWNKYSTDSLLKQRQAIFMAVEDRRIIDSILNERGIINDVNFKYNKDKDELIL